MIRKSVDTLAAFWGQKADRLARTGPDADLDTPELLAEAGVKYIGDWVYDDEPTVIKTAEGPLVTLPYTAETQRHPVMVLQHHEGQYWLTEMRRRLRPALRGRWHAAARDGDCHPPLYLRPAVPHQVPGACL